MNVVLYARSATRAATAQLNALRDFVQQKGWIITDEIIEIERSAISSDAIARVKIALAYKANPILVIEEYDRLSRISLELQSLIQQFEDAGIRVTTINR